MNCVNICIFIHIYVYVYTVCIYVYCIYKHTYIVMHIYLCLYMCVHMCIYLYMYIYIYMCMLSFYDTKFNIQIDVADADLCQTTPTWRDRLHRWSSRQPQTATIQWWRLTLVSLVIVRMWSRCILRNKNSEHVQSVSMNIKILSPSLPGRPLCPLWPPDCLLATGPAHYC